MVRVEAVVDSGATSSFLRASDIDDLGIAASQRAPASDVRLAGGGSMPTVRLAAPVFAAVVHPESGERWSPTFRLEPRIAPAGDRLLGLRDFFRVFEVAFWPEPQARMSLVY